jgi:hypothetical protein
MNLEEILAVGSGAVLIALKISARKISKRLHCFMGKYVTVFIG